MRPNNWRLDKIAQTYNRFIGEGHPPGDETYCLAAAHVDAHGPVGYVRGPANA